jgi:hypothetical protein
MDVKSHRYNPLARRTSARQRLAPFSDGIPRKLHQLGEDLRSYQHILEDEAENARQIRMEYRRRTPQYDQQSKEIEKLYQAVRKIRRAREVLVAPHDNQ